VRRYLFFIFLASIANVVWATSSTPLFVITPLVQAPTQSYQDQTLTAIYELINNTPYPLTNLNIANFPVGITQVITTDPSYCNTNPINLAVHGTCLLKVSINTNSISNSFQWNPKICNSGTHYCSQAYPNDQVSLTLMGAMPQDCQSNASNFNFELNQQFDNGSIVTGWGISPKAFKSNLNSSCTIGSTGIAWQQQRVLDAAAFWIQQKINYCHHYMPDWITPVAQQCSAYAAGGGTGGCCSFEPNINPNSPLVNQTVRWNYSGQGSETAKYWQTYNRMWYGVDCTNYTRLLYNFAFGTLFTGDTPSQAGQDPNGSQATISPNQQTPSNLLNYSCSPGVFVCGDGSMDIPGNFCAGHGGQFATSGMGNYFSIIDQSGISHSSDPAIVAMIRSQLYLLQPGDLVYIAGDLDTGQPSSNVTHAVMWTGKTVGYGSSNINPSQVAPDQYCTRANNCSWQGVDNIGGWVITDSHYQGADYRVFTNFFYLQDLWGVKRIIGSSWTPGTNCNPPD